MENTGISANEVVQVRKCRANGCGDVSKRGALARATVAWKSEGKVKQEKLASSKGVEEAVTPIVFLVSERVCVVRRRVCYIELMIRLCTVLQ